MRPALQKLLSRPTSLELLKCLIGIAPNCRPHTKTQCRRKTAQRAYWNSARNGREKSAYFSTLVSPQQDELQKVDDSCFEVSTPSASYSCTPTTLDVMLISTNESDSPLAPELTKAVPTRLQIRRLQSRPQITSLQETRLKFGKWASIIKTVTALEAQSNLEDLNDGRKLLNRKENENDIQLWAYLLNYRERKYGLAGVNGLWNALTAKRIRIPTEGILADTVWTTFVDAGIHKHISLEHVCKYADWLLENHGDRWGQLYFHILRHYIVFGTEIEGLEWHQRLRTQHRPDDKQFVEFCKLTPSRWSKMTPVRALHMSQQRRDFYGQVIPMLCSQGEFEAAQKWHTWFLKQNDLPKSFKVVEKLIQHYALYYPTIAVQSTKSLVTAGFSFADSEPLNLPEYVKDLILSPKRATNVEFSREFINIVHAKTFNISAKSYDDKLGSRWLATKWVSLDVSISTLHALGTDEIGPLSLQAIALREPQAARIISRIGQLSKLGISIGKSTYSRAIERFARTGRTDYLDGLLHSDQHPDTYEDRKLQEALLSEYVQTNRWSDYRRTLAIYLINFSSPEIEKHNIVLRTSLVKGDNLNIKQNLLQMRSQGIPVTPRTISFALRHVLRHRDRLGPALFSFPVDDVEDSIDILLSLMKTGCHVPPNSWFEIIRRLGLTGHLERLENLCLTLARQYRQSNQMSRAYKIPPRIPTSHRLHPLKKLFTPALQRALVEWGFIHSIGTAIRRADALGNDDTPLSFAGLPLTFGISLIKKLREEGVAIDGRAVRKGVLHRLIAYYGQGRSTQAYNGMAKARMGLPLNEVVNQIDEAFGGEYFRRLDVARLIENFESTRVERALRRKRKTSVLRLASPNRNELSTSPQYNP